MFPDANLGTKSAYRWLVVYETTGTNDCDNHADEDCRDWIFGRGSALRLKHFPKEAHLSLKVAIRN